MRSFVDSVQMKLLASPLTTMIFRVDDKMFVGPHFYRKPSKATVTLELDKSGWFFGEYDREFSRLWDAANDVSLDGSKNEANNAGTP